MKTLLKKIKKTFNMDIDVFGIIKNITIIDKNDYPNNDDFEVISAEFGGYIGAPSCAMTNYENYVKYIMNKINVEYFAYREYNKYLDISGIIKFMLDKFDKGIKFIYTKITYPLTTPSYFKFELEDNCWRENLLFVFVHNIAYKLTYAIEDETMNDNKKKEVSNSLNRTTSNGKYGIWGHCIEDLIYLPPTVYINKDTALCRIGCDS